MALLARLNPLSTLKDMATQNLMASLLGIQKGRVPYRDALATERPFEEVAVVETPQADRFMAAANLTGGNNSLENPAAIQRSYLLELQREAQRQAALGRGRTAVDALKARQWMDGTRTTADGEAAPAGYVAPFNPNGVSNGVAYRNGAPVGFAGSVPGVAAIPEGGFNPVERTAFNRSLLDAASASRPVAMPQSVAVAPPVSVTEEVIAPATPAAMQSISPAAYSFALGPNNPFRMAMNQGVMPAAPVVASAPAIRPRASRATIEEIQSERANLERGTAARQQLTQFEQQLPEVLATLGAETGVALDEDVLANQILSDDDQVKGKKKSTPGSYGNLTLYKTAERLGIEPKVLVRWANDRKKKKA